MSSEPLSERLLINGDVSDSTGTEASSGGDTQGQTRSGTGLGSGAPQG